MSFCQRVVHGLRAALIHHQRVKEPSRTITGHCHSHHCHTESKLVDELSDKMVGCQELDKLPVEKVRDFFDSFDCIMADCDGVIWIGNNATEKAPETVQALRAMGKRIFFCTNNSTKSRDDYVKKCETLGFGGEKDDIVGTSYLAASYLKSIGFKGKVYALGMSGLCKELDEVGIEYVGPGPDPTPEDWTIDYSHKLMAKIEDDVRCVVCGFDSNLSYVKMAKAATILARKDSIFIATNTDEQFPCGNGVILPGTGSIVSAVAVAAEKKPIVMGKPSTMMFDVVQKVHPEIDPKRTLMIGDRANTDILLGKNCNLQTLMVGSGVHSLDDIRRWEKSTKEEDRRLCADYFIPKLGDLLSLLKKAYE